MRIRNNRHLCLVFCMILSMFVSGCSFGDSDIIYSTQEEKQTMAISLHVNDTLQETESQTEPSVEDEINDLLNSMTLEEKIAQLFVVCPEDLHEDSEPVITAGEMLKEAIAQTPVSGFIFMGNHLQSEEQVQALLKDIQMYSMDRIGLPSFFCVWTKREEP